MKGNESSVSSNSNCKNTKYRRGAILNNPSTKIDAATKKIPGLLPKFPSILTRKRKNSDSFSCGEEDSKDSGEFLKQCKIRLVIGKKLKSGTNKNRK